MTTITQRPIQLNLFEPTIINSEQLLAVDSPRCAFYRIWLIQDKTCFTVKKESGTKKKKLDTREWVFDQIEIAEKFYSQKIRQKTNPNRKNRKYKKVN